MPHASKFCGEQRQSLAVPRIGGHAGNGNVIEVHGSEFVVVQDAGDKVANTGDGNFVAVLQDSMISLMKQRTQQNKR